MKKTMITLSIFFIIFIVGCSTNVNPPEHNSSVTIPELPMSISKIELLEVMDATNLLYIEPLDENTVYTIGSKRDKSLPALELVYGVCSLDTGNVSVLHREIISTDWAENMNVFADESGEIKLFTGQQILTVDNSKVTDIKNVVDDQSEVSVHLGDNKMVFIEDTPPSLYYGVLGSNDNKILIFESKEVEIENQKTVLFPFGPQLNNAGDKILYGTALHDASLYQAVVISSIDGEQLAKTEQLPINSDYLHMLWYKDGFITLEQTDSYEHSPTGLATIFTKYNENAEEQNRIVLNGNSLAFQRKFYPNTTLFAFSYKTESTNGLALWDASTEQAYYVCDIDGRVLSPTVSPNGKRILWFNNGCLYFENIALEEYEKLPTY